MCPMPGQNNILPFSQQNKTKSKPKSTSKPSRKSSDQSSRKSDETPIPVIPEWVKQSNLIQTIRDDLTTIGIVGESHLSFILYLVGTSRIQKKPLSTIVQGHSSSGKSYLVGKVSGLFPPECILNATRITPQSLYHLEGISNKWVIGGERSRRQDDQVADATAALRQLQSEGQISKLITEQVEGKWVSRLITQLGPIAYTETTTLEGHQVFKEDLNRMLLIQTDPSPEQTRRILNHLAQPYLGTGKDVEKDSEKVMEVMRRHHVFQRALTVSPVQIPYVEELLAGIEVGRVEVRRAVGQILTMIETVVLLHQFQREKVDGCLLATKEDYHLVRELLAGPMQMSLGMDEVERGYHQRLWEKYHGTTPFDTMEVVRLLELSDRAARRLLQRFSSLGLVTCTRKGSSHQPSVWKVHPFTTANPLPLLNP